MGSVEKVETGRRRDNKVKENMDIKLKKKGKEEESNRRTMRTRIGRETERGHD